MKNFNLKKALCFASILFLAATSTSCVKKNPPSSLFPQGAYFVTDEGWEKYIRQEAVRTGQDEEWIEAAIEGDFGSGILGTNDPTRTNMRIIISEDKMNILGAENCDGGPLTLIVEFFLCEDKYQGDNGSQSVSFTFENDFLILSSSGERNQSEIQYMLDKSYQVSKEKITPPNSLEINVSAYNVTWNYLGENTFGSFAKIKHVNECEYTPLTVLTLIPNSYSSPILNLQTGTSILKVGFIGGPYLNYDNHTIEISLDTNERDFEISVDEDGEIIAIEEL